MTNKTNPNEETNKISNFPNEFEIDKEFTRLEALGNGAYSTVYKVINNKTGEQRAEKTIKSQFSSFQKGIDPMVLREIVILNDLNHKNIVKLHDAFSKRGDYALIFECMKSNIYSLIDLIHINNNEASFKLIYHLKNRVTKVNISHIKPIYNYLIQFIFKEILEGVKYIHLKNVIHRDIKPANILLDYGCFSLEDSLCSMIVNRFYNENQCKNHFVTPIKRTSFTYQSTDENSIYNELRQDSNYVCQSNTNTNTNTNSKSIGNAFIFNHSSKISNDVVKIKISDFGLARLLNNSSENMKYTSGLVTLYYRSPEILLNSNEYDESVDIWSIGCIFAEILMGFPLFPGENELDQLQKIFKILGTPSFLTGNNSLFNRKYFLNTFSPKCIKEIINQVNPLVDESALEIVDSCLRLNHNERLNSRKLLKLRFFKKEFQFLNEEM